MTETHKAAVEALEYYLLSHGLYFRPEARGYTGIRDEAGLFTKEYAEKYCDGGCVTMLHKDDPKATETTIVTHRYLIDAHIRKLKQERDEAREQLRTLQQPSSVDVTVNLDRYDAGYLGDGGGGDVSWWQDYTRAELERAHEHYQSQVDGLRITRAAATDGVKS